MVWSVPSAPGTVTVSLAQPGTYALGGEDGCGELSKKLGGYRCAQSRKESPSNASVVMRSSEWSMESRMHRSRNATMTCLWPAQCLVGGKGKRYAERHQEGRIHFIHHGTPTHSQHQRILGRGFRARQGIINEWLRRNLNGCRFARECAVPCKRGAAEVERLFPFWHVAPFRCAAVVAIGHSGH